MEIPPLSIIPEKGRHLCQGGYGAILWWKNQPEAMGKSQGRLAKPRGASEKFWIFAVGFRAVSPA